MNPREIEAARLLLARLGIRPEDLLGAVNLDRPKPTFGEYIRCLETAIPPGSLRTYGPYWRRVCESWNDRPIDEPTALEIRQLIEQTRQQAVIRSNSRGGRSAAEHMVGALRCLYRHAQDDGLVSSAENPAIRVEKPRRLPSSRRALSAQQLADINRIAATTGNDPDLDTLILRLHIETACRRGGAIALRAEDLDPAQCLIRLREKGETVRWQPVSPTLMAGLLLHQERGSQSDGQLLRYLNGQPITARRYDYIWRRLGQHLPWVATHRITAHWLRHTTLTWVERHYGYAIARAYAGHAEPTGRDGSTLTYVRASMAEIATALAELTSEPHPLAGNP